VEEYWPTVNVEDEVRQSATSPLNVTRSYSPIKKNTTDFEFVSGLSWHIVFVIYTENLKKNK